MPDTSLSINPQTVLILYDMWSQTQNQIYKYILCIVMRYSNLFSIDVCAISQVILAAKSNMQIIGGVGPCRVFGLFWAKFQKTHTATSIFSAQPWMMKENEGK